MLALLQGELLPVGISPLFLWFTWGGMTLATVLFLFWAATGQQKNLHHYVTSAVITLWAAMSYLVMATGSGVYLVGEADGARVFYWVRYIDWLITTPLLLLGLAWVALGQLNRNTSLVGLLVISDVVMIITGLISGANSGFIKWFFFLLSCLAFLVVLYLIWVPLQAAAQTGQSGEASLFFPLAIMLTVLWVIYPVVFLIGTEGLDAIPISVEVFVYAVLDILAKIGFGIVLLGGIRRLTESGGSSGRTGSRVSA